MPNRRAVRRPRRVQVHFWKRGEFQAHPGYTTNISTTGMFLATNSPQPPGTRLRIEVLEGDRGFMLEGVVAHARKVRNELMRVSQPGMGIRFLTVEELVRELIPVLPGETEEIPMDSLAAATPRQGVSPPLSPSPPAAGPRPAVEASPPLPPTPLAAPAHPAPSPPPASRPIEASGVFSVSFLGVSEFLEVFQRDISQGGLFVSTRFPARLQETVRIELRLPGSETASVFLSARVVQRFEPQEGSFGPNLLSGMGVEIHHLGTLLAELRPIVERLRAGG